MCGFFFILFPLLVCHTFTTEGPLPVNNRQDGDVQVQHITTFKALIYSFFWFTLINQNYNKILQCDWSSPARFMQ